MSNAKEIIARMSDNCPQCFNPVEKDPAVFNKNRVRCVKCGKTYGPNELVKAAQCPHCKKWICLKDEKLEYECPQCEKKLVLYEDGFREDIEKVNETNSISPDRIIQKSKLTSFSDHTVIHTGAGFDLLLVRGKNIQVINADEVFPFGKEGSNETIDAELYYVRSCFPESVACGTKDSLLVFDQNGVPYELQAAASIGLKISDPVLFFKWVGYKECVLSDLVNTYGSANLKMLDQKIMACFPEALAQAVQAAQKNTGKEPDMLSKVDIGNTLRECMTSGLFEIGLSCDNVDLRNFTAVPGKDLLMERVERKVQWDSEPITVHEKDNPEYSAEISLHGEGRIRIRDRVQLRKTPEGQKWAKKETDDNLAQRILSEEVARVVHAAFNDILQPMIDDTGVRLGSIDRFLNYMQNNIQTYLNNSEVLESLGLEISGVSLKLPKDGYKPSPALSARDGAVTKMATYREEENMRRFMDNVRIEQEKDASKVRIAVGGIQAEEEKEKYHQEKILTEINESRKDDKTGSEIRDIERRNELDKAQNKAAHEAAERREETEDHERARAAKIEDEKKARQNQAELDAYDHSYEVWLRQRKLRTSDNDAARFDEEAKKTHELKMIAMEEEAARNGLLADEKTKAAVQDLMRGIQESDFELRKKLEAYAYLQKLTEQKDHAELWENEERTKADIQQLLKKIDLEDAQGYAALFEKAENDRAEREEKHLQTEYVRDMELRRMNLSHEIEKMKLETERIAQVAELNAKEQDRAERLELLQTNLVHIEKLEEQNTNRTGIQAELDKVKAICDYLKTDSMARAAQAAKEQERLQKESELQEGSLEKLAGQVDDLQKQLGEMLKANEAEYQKGIQEVRDMVGAAARDQKFEDMFREMKHAIEMIRERAQQVERLNAEKTTPIVQNIYQRPSDNPGRK